MSSEHVEVLRDLSEVCRAAIKAGDWKVDGACDPDSLLRHADSAIAALSAPQPPAESHEDEVVCLECGQPTMHMGQVCYACLHPADDPAEAQAQGGGEAELRRMVARLAAHVRPTCGELWAEAERLLNRTAPPSAPVGDSLLQTALRNLPQYISKSGLVGPDKHAAMQCFETMRDALAQQPEGVVCLNCGKPTARVGQVCDACSGAIGHQPAAAGEEIMVNAAHDVYTLPLQPSGLSSGPRFVVHVPGPEQPAAPTLAKYQPCGCVICTCEDEQQCQGCGAKHCGNRTDHPAHVEQQPAAVDGACAAAAIRFALTDPEGMTFLRIWNEGDFDTLRREWPDAPVEVYIDADPLAAQPGGSDNDR